MVARKMEPHWDSCQRFAWHEASRAEWAALKYMHRELPHFSLGRYELPRVVADMAAEWKHMVADFPDLQRAYADGSMTRVAVLATAKQRWALITYTMREWEKPIYEKARLVVDATRLLLKARRDKNIDPGRLAMALVIAEKWGPIVDRYEQQHELINLPPPDYPMKSGPEARQICMRHLGFINTEEVA